jgi:hypothetical protein
MALHAKLAWSDGARVVVIDPGPRVLEAIDVALSPWNLHVVRTAGPLPQAEIGAATTTARSLAESERAGAVIWVAPPSGSQALSLWVYETQTAELIVRPLSVAAPFDDAGAAAIALSVKTIMRGTALVEASAPPPSSTSTPRPSVPPASTATPPAVSANPAPSTSAGPAPAAAATPVAPTAPPSHDANRDASKGASHDAGKDAGRPVNDETNRDASGRERKNESQSSALEWRLETIVGARMPTAGTSPAEPQAAVGASAWPTSFHGHAGIGAVLQFGPGTSIDKIVVDGRVFQGQFTQGDLAVSARARTTEGRFGFELQAGLSARFTNLDGTILPTTQLHKFKVDPAVDGAAAVDIALGSHVGIGALVDVCGILFNQTYELDAAAQLFTQPRVDFLLGARLSVEVD